MTEVTTIWESVTAIGSRGRTIGRQGVIVQVNKHHIADDVAVLDQSTKLDVKDTVIDTTTFRPGLVSDPAFRACAGRSWPIPPVAATYKSAQANASASTPAGTLKIVGIRERVTVPAGTFETVHYIRTSQSTDEYWKSIEHGVVVKHIATLPMGTVTETCSRVREGCRCKLHARLRGSVGGTRDSALLAAPPTGRSPGTATLHDR